MLLANYLFFDKQTSEAFDFYAKCLDGKVAMKITFGEMPGCDQMPKAMQKLIAHVRLEVGDAVLMASDWCSPSGEPYPGIRGSRVCLTIDEPVEAERLFAALSEGGEVMMPLAETSWALRFGMFTDRFGAQWMITCNRPK